MMASASGKPALPDAAPESLGCLIELAGRKGRVTPCRVPVRRFAGADPDDRDLCISANHQGPDAGRLLPIRHAMPPGPRDTAAAASGLITGCAEAR
jgi:hypothetical protein